MLIDGPPQLGVAYECQSCGDLTMHYETCPSYGSDDLEPVD